MKIPQVQTTDRQINQLQTNIRGAIEPQFADVGGQFTAGLTGCVTTPAVLAYWARGVADGPVTVSFPKALTASSNSGVATVTGFPQSIWPVQAQTVVVPISDNGTVTMSSAVMAINGVLTLSKGFGGAFGFSGTKGLAPCSFTYVQGL